MTRDGLAFDNRKVTPAMLLQEPLKALRIALHQHLDAVAGLEQEGALESLPRLTEERRFIGEPERFERCDICSVVTDTRERERDRE